MADAALVNGNGDSNTTFLRDAAGFSYIGGNVSITNGAGVDNTYVTDMNVGGSVTVNDGHGDGTNAGKTEFFNTYNTGTVAPTIFDAPVVINQGADDDV
jgi:hypothetical protein